MPCRRSQSLSRSPPFASRCGSAYTPGADWRDDLSLPLAGRSLPGHRQRASALWAGDAGPSLQTAIDLAKDLLIFWVLVELISQTHTLKLCCSALTLVAGALGALSIYQYASGTFKSDHGGFAQASVRQIVGSENLYRLSGPIGDPNCYALILLVVVPLGLAVLRTHLHVALRALVLGAVVLIAAAVLLT